MLRARAGSVIAGRWKLVGDQLFDLATDPYEKTDVAVQHAAIVERLKTRVAKFSALRKVSRDRMNATQLAPVPLWTLPEARQFSGLRQSRASASMLRDCACPSRRGGDLDGDEADRRVMARSPRHLAREQRTQ
jgi:hypothetical protein